MTEKPPNAREIALKRISHREQSSTELKTYLRRKGVEENEAKEAVDALIADGWIDDRRFSAAVARSEAARGKGPMAVLAKLRRRGVRADLGQARELFQDAGTTEVEAVLSLLSRRYSDIDRSDRKELGRVYQSLLRRGFSSASILAALKTPLDEPVDG